MISICLLAILKLHKMICDHSLNCSLSSILALIFDLTFRKKITNLLVGEPGGP
jgi:hypothetical protein